MHSVYGELVSKFLAVVVCRKIRIWLCVAIQMIDGFSTKKGGCFMAAYFFRFICSMIIWFVASTVPVRAAQDQILKSVTFDKGASSASVKGSVKGSQYIDYQLRAQAGQKLTISLKASNKANYFNLLPPDSANAAMAVGEFLGNRYTGSLPDDGLYTIRVFLIRSSARRGESSNFKLDISVTGNPLVAISSKLDSLVPGTRFHARAAINCKPPYVDVERCEAGVIRRNGDSATVEVTWGDNQKRRILFVDGKPVAADVMSKMNFMKNGRDDWVISFDNVENYEIPEVLINGG